MCITGVLLSLALMGCSKQAATSPSSKGSDTAPAVAVESARAWVATLDSGSFSKAWGDAAATMRSTMSLADFDKGLQSLRVPLGKMKSRDIKAQRNMPHSPGLPEGDRWIVAYNTTFETKSNVDETLVLVLEQDGQWRVTGYSLP